MAVKSHEKDSLLPLVQKKEVECRQRVEEAQKEAVRLVAEAKEKAKQAVEETEKRVREREQNQLRDQTKALEAALTKGRQEDKEKLKALEAELKKRLPHASEEILKMILPS